MSQIVLLRWGATEWDAQGRIVGHTDLPLSAAGARQVAVDASELAAFRPTAVYSGIEEAARQTASAVARPHRLRVRKRVELCEVNLGHWEGLTDEQFRERFPRVYRQWYDEPSAVCPPEGESIVDASERLHSALKRALRRAGDGDVFVVTGPLAGAILRLRLTHQPLDGIWKVLEDGRRWHALPRPDAAPPAAAPPAAAPPPASPSQQAE